MKSVASGAWPSIASHQLVLFIVPILGTYRQFESESHESCISPYRSEDRFGPMWASFSASQASIIQQTNGTNRTTTSVNQASPTPATVYLIGAGPGDPGLLTVRGRECLQRADIVLYDYLAGPRLLESARSDAELHCLGRHGQGKIWTQPQINQRMVEAAQAGQTVARLKGGDPNIFGRLAEEVDALNAAGVPFEVVPGVTTAVATGAYAGVTITHRELSSCVAFITGQEKPGKTDSAIDYAALAKFPGTLVIYMGVTTAANWSGQLIDNGLTSDTPVLLVRRCSLPDQETIATKLGEVAQVLAPGRMRPPLVAIVGQVATEPVIGSWFIDRPLFGQTVLVTRPRHQAAEMVSRLRELGAEVLLQPVIEISPPEDWSAIDEAINLLHTFDWVVFSSRNGVDYLMNRVKELGKDSRIFGPTQLAAIGPATAHALAKYSLRADLHPEEYRAEALAEALSGDAASKKILLIRASRGREILAEQLSAAGAEVEQVIAYRSADVTEPNSEIAAALSEGKIDWTTATSSAIARSLVNLFGQDLTKSKLAAISPITADVLSELNCPPAATATEYTADGVIEAMLT